MKAKCKCGCIWDYSYDDMKVEPIESVEPDDDDRGHGLVITLYCPNCHYPSFAYNPNHLVKQVSPSYVDSRPLSGYTWE